ncbi:MAG: tetratricopeptide repeat protein, partial [Betaproteobacteria bacterium]
TLVRIGMGYSGLGQHDKAVALIQQGIKKGGLRLPQQAQLHLGIALARAGQKDRAAQALRTVTGTDGAAELARLWLRALSL